jgi:hypothetical protein
MLEPVELEIVCLHVEQDLERGVRFHGTPEKGTDGAV